uniref:Pleckstrin homology domain containing O2 n=1 Tax=Sphenodon punctatus TaxID=8508 RepID=A0A8D0GTE7_SPHPU
GVKEESPEKPKHASTADKAGWIKKSSGGLLGLWRERYILLRKAQLLVYEDEDEQKCLETVELGSYDKCQDLRALLKRKNRFILIRVPGNKVHNIKFQAPSGEEKEEWMKALNEGINRGKNKILDEVKVDESLSLDHVTRGRVKVAQVRRPPTRTHLKESFRRVRWQLLTHPRRECKDTACTPQDIKGRRGKWQGWSQTAMDDVI